MNFRSCRPIVDLHRSCVRQSGNQLGAFSTPEVSDAVGNLSGVSRDAKTNAEYLQQALLPPLKFSLSQYGSTFCIPDFFHVHILPSFIESKVIFIWVELEQLSIVLLQVPVKLWVFFGKLRKLD